MGFADFLAAMEVTEEEFEEQVTEAAKSNLKENLTAELIAEKEDISMTDEEYGKAKEELADGDVLRRRGTDGGGSGGAQYQKLHPPGSGEGLGGKELHPGEGIERF